MNLIHKDDLYYYYFICVCVFRLPLEKLPHVYPTRRYETAVQMRTGRHNVSEMSWA